VIAFIALGSNLGDRAGYLRDAARELSALGEVEVSSVYETTPVGGPPGQGAYLNCVVRLRTDLCPRELLAAGQRLEREAGRVRSARWGARTLDVDLLLLDDLTIDDEDLVVPHPRMYERAFVLAPLEELAPDKVPDGWRERVAGSVELEESVRRVGTLKES
jgi:2-amino-4-hydroxy-6-hydroxymethyldihydropteridine diphosphokinase